MYNNTTANPYESYYRDLYSQRQNSSVFNASPPYQYFPMPATTYPPLPDGSTYANGGINNDLKAVVEGPNRCLASQPAPWCTDPFATSTVNPRAFNIPREPPLALHAAVAAGSVEEAERILEKLSMTRNNNRDQQYKRKAQDEQDEMGRTALHIAASLGHVALVELLLKKYGCDTTIRDNWGRTALEVVESISSRYATVTAALGGRQPLAEARASDELKATHDHTKALADNSKGKAHEQLPQAVDCECGNTINLEEYMERQNDNSQPLGLTFCPIGHQLKLRPKLSPGAPQRTFICDECNHRSFTGERSLRCNDCDYDQCVSCIAKERNIHCKSGGHRLRRFVASNEENYCDLCNGRYPQGTVFAACYECNEFLCLDCVGTKLF